MFHEAKEQEARLLEVMSNNEQSEAALPSGSLVEISPKKTPGPVVSENTDLLVDIETEAPLALPQGRVRHTETFSYIVGGAPPKNADKTPAFDLLD